MGARSKTGKALIGLASLGALGNIGKKKIHGVLGAAVLGGLGSYLIHLDKKKKQAGGRNTKGANLVFRKHLISHLKKLMKKHPNLDHKLQSVMTFIKQHQGTLLHISDLFGPQWRTRGMDLINIINQLQNGSGLFSKIGKALKTTIKKSSRELKKFAEGKTKFKPSTLANYLASAVGAAGTASAFIPGVDLISVPAAAAVALGLQSASLALKTSGRGIRLAGRGPGTALPPGVMRLPSGKIKKDRYSVFHGFHKKTSSGLTKSAFMLKGKKVISVKKHNMGKAMKSKFGKK